MKRVRVVLCGDVAVGKSSIIQRFSQRKFVEGTTTLAGAFHSQYVKIENQHISLEIWDTAGSERYYSVIPSFFRNASAVVLVFDLTNRESFNKLDFWYDFASRNSPSSIPIFLAGNKSDLFFNRIISNDEAHKFSESKFINSYFETSAKTGESIDDLFTSIALVPTSFTSDNNNLNIENCIELNNKSICCYFFFFINFFFMNYFSNIPF